jgi:hypothetical protein
MKENDSLYKCIIISKFLRACGNEISPEKRYSIKYLVKKGKNYEQIDGLHCSKRFAVSCYTPNSNTHPHVYAVTNDASIYGPSFQIQILYSRASHH